LGFILLIYEGILTVTLFELVTCHEQLEEIRRASRYPKFKAILQPHRVGLMLNNMQSATVMDRLPSGYEAADPNDTFLLALADKSQAHYLVTGDKRAGILSLLVIGQTQIVTASVFCDKVL
jgi:predicted nucleic acid-binding protein